MVYAGVNEAARVWQKRHFGGSSNPSATNSGSSTGSIHVHEETTPNVKTVGGKEQAAAATSTSTTTNSSSSPMSPPSTDTYTLHAQDSALSALQQQQQHGTTTTTTTTTDHHPHTPHPPTIHGDACWAQDIGELISAIEEYPCSLIILNGDVNDPSSYVFHEEIAVNRHIVIQGDSVLLPLLDAGDSPRAFRVSAQGYLELRYLQLKSGHGHTHTLPDGRERIEVRGGGVLFEPGARGGVFVGVNFLGDHDGLEHVRDNIRHTLEMTSIRTYGGHVLIYAGVVSFVGCVFVDFEVFLPFTDDIHVGGDILVLGGRGELCRVCVDVHHTLWPRKWARM